MRVHRLRNTILAYDWGSRTGLASLAGRPCPSPGPEAEMWIGAHAAAPSRLAEQAGAAPLDRAVADAPDAMLGREVRRRFGDRLPFLLKVLAAEVPLSLQAHPSRAQAVAGFAREEALGIPRGARERNYKDPWAKPEVLCALGPFEALCGFRPLAESAALLARLDLPALEPARHALEHGRGEQGLEQAFRFLLAVRDAGELVDAVAAACRREATRDAAHAANLAWIVELARLHPGDAGVAAALLLNHVQLEAGEALYLPAGNLHSYLRGMGVELMASSDNVLRGGLTSKHVDVEELCAILDFGAGPCRRVPVREADDGEREYVTPAPDFRLSVRTLLAGSEWRPLRRGPELLLCTQGEAVIASPAGLVALAAGGSVFVEAGEGSYAVRGAATIYRATVGNESLPS